MEEILNKIMSDLEILKEHLKDISSTAHSNAELIKRNGELIERNYKQPLQNERVIKQNRELINRNKKLIEQNGRLLKQVLTRLQRVEAKAGATVTTRRKKELVLCITSDNY